MQKAGIRSNDYLRMERTVQDYATLIGQMPLNTKPGEKYAYSSMGYIVLGVIVEQVTGQSFNEAMQERICKPLGLQNTGFAYDTEVLERLAGGYVRGFIKDAYGNLKPGYSEEAYRDQSNKYCTGGIHSTVGDMFVWTRALWRNTLLTQEWRDKMWTPQADDYGYGWNINKGSDIGLEQFTEVISHGGSLTGYKAIVSMAEKGAYTVIVLGNSNGTAARQVAGGIFNLLTGKTKGMNLNGSNRVVETLVTEGATAARKQMETLKRENYVFRADTFNNAGYALISNGFKSEAVTLFDFAVDTFPDDLNLFDSRAEALMSAGRYEEAKQGYEASLNRAQAAGNQFLIQNAKTMLKQLRSKKP